MAVPQEFLDSLFAGGPSSPAHFMVDIQDGPDPKKLPFKFRCHQAVLPGLTAATSQYATGMPEKNNAYRATFEDVTLGFYCTEDLIEREFFERWQGEIFPTHGHRMDSRGSVDRKMNWTTWPVAYRNSYVRKIKIQKLSLDGLPTRAYFLHNAFPVTVNETPMEWGQEEVLKIEVVFSYDWWTAANVNYIEDLDGKRIHNAYLSGHTETDITLENQPKDEARKRYSAKGRSSNQQRTEYRQRNDEVRKRYSAKVNSSTQSRTEYRQSNDEVREKRTITEDSVRGQFWLPQDTPFMGPPSPTDAQRKQMASDMRKDNFAAKHPDALMGMLADAKRPGNLAAVAMKSVTTPPPIDTPKQQTLETGFKRGNFKKKTRVLAETGDFFDHKQL